jgi:hypothetical protein
MDGWMDGPLPLLITHPIPIYVYAVRERRTIRGAQKNKNVHDCIGPSRTIYAAIARHVINVSIDLHGNNQSVSQSASQSNPEYETTPHDTNTRRDLGAGTGPGSPCNPPTYARGQTPQEREGGRDDARER